MGEWVRASSCCSSPHGHRMFSERAGPLALVARPEGRVALAATVLALVQACGLVLALYMLVGIYLEGGGPTDPASHLCTEALTCLLFRHGPLLHQVRRGHTLHRLNLTWDSDCTQKCIPSCYNPFSYKTSILPELIEG